MSKKIKKVVKKVLNIKKKEVKLLINNLYYLGKKVSILPYNNGASKILFEEIFYFVKANKEISIEKIKEKFDSRALTLLVTPKRIEGKILSEYSKGIKNNYKPLENIFIRNFKEGKGKKILISINKDYNLIKE